jgi:uncharacterized surface protein with fasciclin (FAS1) repeats
MPRLAAALLAAAALAGCSGSDDERPAPTRGVSGPLCAALPAGDDPGAPASLTDETADVALTWIPVITTFEAAARASGLAEELRDADAVTILAPTDDAFTAAFSRQRLDDLLLGRRGGLRELLDAHVVEGAQSLSELLDAGRVTTRSGDTLTVTRAGAMARFDDRAETACADYAVANGTIHVIDAVLGSAR